MLRKSSYKDMNKYRKTRNAQKRRYYGKTQKYERRKWTSEEDKRVLEHNISDTELSQEIKRSVCSIQNRRHRLINELIVNQ